MKSNPNSKQIQRLTKLAVDGDAAAQFSLAMVYQEGKAVPADDAEAAKWYRKAAEQGHAQAQRALADCYVLGKGVARSDEESVRWYRLAAEQGNAGAQFQLGSRYYMGQGVTKDEEEAERWLRQAAEQGHANAKECVSDLVDLRRLEGCVQGAKEGNPRSQLSLAVAFDMGLGAPRDEAASAMWYRKAAESGNAQAQRALADCYSAGKGVPQDDGEAVKWFRRAAEQGYASAQFRLGIAYRTGIGTSKNLDEAQKWLRMAAEQGNPEAAELLEMEGGLKTSSGVAGASQHGSSEEPSESIPVHLIEDWPYMSESSRLRALAAIRGTQGEHPDSEAQSKP